MKNEKHGHPVVVGCRRRFFDFRPRLANRSLHADRLRRSSAAGNLENTRIADGVHTFRYLFHRNVFLVTSDG